MPDNNELKLILKYLVDKGSETSAKNSINSVEQAMNKLKQQSVTGGVGSTATGGNKFMAGEDVWAAVLDRADQYNESIEVACQNLAKMGTTGLATADDIKVAYEFQNGLLEQQDKAIRRTDDGLMGMGTTFDDVTRKANQTAESVKNIDKNTQQLNKNVRRGGSMMMMGMTGFTLAMTGMQIQRLGQAGLSPISKYLDSLDESQRASSAWVKNQEKIEKSMVRIGAVMADELLPTFEKIAELAEKAAAFVEKNPELAKSAASVFGGAVVGGGLLAGFGNILSAIASFGSLSILMKGGFGGAAAGGLGRGLLGGALANPVTGMVGAAGLIGAGLYGIFKKLGIEEWTRALPLLGAPGTFAMMLMQLEKQFQKLTTSTSTGQTTATVAPSTTTGQIEAYLDYFEKQKAAEQEYALKRVEITRSYNSKMLNMEREYQLNRAQAIRSFQLAEAQYLADYYLSRKQAAAQHSNEMADMEEDHQARMKSLRKDHEANMEDLAANRDALGMIREMRRYERERKEAEEEHNREVRQRNADFALQLQEMGENFALQRQARMQDFQLKLQEAAENYKLQRQQETEQYRQELKDLQESYLREKKLRREELGKQLQDTFDALTQERLLRQKFSQAMLDDLQAYINAIKNSTPGTSTQHYSGRDSGGYMVPGIYRNSTGRAEYALKPDTVTMLERLSGGRLTQNSILRLAAGGMSRGGMVYNDYSRYSGDVSAAEKRKMRNEQLEMMAEVYGSI